MFEWIGLDSGCIIYSKMFVALICLPHWITFTVLDQ